MRVKFIFLFLLFLSPLLLNAQQANIDESISDLSQKIENAQQGERLKWMDSLTLLVEFNEDYNYDSLVQQTISYAMELDSVNIATRNIAQYIYYHYQILGKPQEGIEIFNTYLESTAQLENHKTKSLFYFQGANAYYALYDLEPALQYYRLAKEHAQNGHEEILGNLSLRIGGILIETGESAEASQELQAAVKLFRQQNDTMGIIDAKNNISILYSQHAFYEEAAKERNEAIELVKEFSGVTILSLFYFNAAADYRMIGDQKNRIRNIRLALENNYSKHKDFFEPFFLCDLVIALAENDSLEEAEKYFDQIESNLATYSEGRYKESYIETLKQLELARGNYYKALDYGKQHLALKEKGNVYVEIMNAQKFLSDVYQKINDESNSKKHLLKYYRIKDSITNIQNAKNLLLYQTLYETEKRDYQIDAQQKDIELLNTQNKIKTQWMAFGGLGLLSVFAFVLVVRSRNTARKEQSLQQTFSQHLISAQESERSRVAFELHDSVGQQLMMIKRKSKSIGDAILESLTSSTLENLRFISRNLHPVAIEQLGLTAAIKDLVADFEGISATKFEVDIEDVDALLDKKVELHIYRIFQEAISNLIKHADAEKAFISLKKSGNNLRLIIKDSGKGFDYDDKVKTSKSLGMKSLDERCKIINAALTIDSAPMQGTEILIIIPLNNL